ncbi:MAG: CBS domain-containing protein [Candidatus Nanoarchaeia archaeon]|nr:CBS domain-containing protein [Candidatus Haiyanarchaeum thermophilum]MCW1303238.1 CBS domain-containing protein [Candidatus Haiyanarchaeum thermophilum]MCW1304030.1 CBS domain-containing protein [Candidatus Haiyanarchaeum thermophilum]MCW1307304.1 CBS domain-containing protein [Candidatus Haiyanarchaeum thermophilum]MCW1308028.1 CBS domain-containing protein [Candidatus Haiyanarchaeum thermophilum]
MILAKDIMTTKPVTIRPEASIVEASKLMLRRGVGSLLVVNKQKVIGILTEKDIISKVVSKNKDPKKVKVKDVMTTELITVGPELDLFEIAKIMNSREVRRLPVCDGDKLLGLVTEKDILKFAPSLIYILTEKMKLRGPKNLSSKSREYRYTGACEICGNFSENLREKRGMLICEFCSESV